MHIEASIESISFDGSNHRNLTSNVLNLASLAPKHHNDRLFTEASMDLEMSSAIFSDFLYFFYPDMLQKEVGLLIPFTKRGKQLNLASFAPKHHDDRLFTEASMNFQMSSAIFSDFLYFFYLDMLQKEVWLLVSFTKRGKQLNLAQFLVIPFMSKEMGIHKRDFLQLLSLNTARTVLLKNFQHLIQML